MSSWQQERAKIWQIMFRHKRRIEELEERVKFLTSESSEHDGIQVEFEGNQDGLDDLDRGRV
ncbi:MAG: hypothetical protein AB1815_03070 [Bacillota bacterium]